MKLYYILFLALCTHVGAQDYWKSISNERDITPFEHQKNIYADQLFSLNDEVFQNQLQYVQSATWVGTQPIELEFPNEKGKLETYQVFEFSNFEEELQLEYPNIRSYVGNLVSNPAQRIRFSFSHKGLTGMIQRPGKSTLFIEPYTENSYVVFSKRALSKEGEVFECTTEDIALDIEDSEPQNTTFSNTGVFKTFRLAVSADGQYTNFHGGTVTDALAAINNTLTRLNGIYEVDLGLHLNLISNTTSVIYTNPNTDPYTGNPNSQLQNTLTNVIGEANYDIGHLLSANGGGGNAGCIGCICNDGYKGSGYSASGSPIGDYYDVDYVAHEIGHQLGANHTFSFSPAENLSYNVEPGSGSTIMGYAGITGQYDVQDHSDDYFVYKSIEQVQNNLANKPCATNINTNNDTPEIPSLSPYTIPIGTAFKLTGTATDNQQSALTYNWDQNDDAHSSNLGSNSFPSPTKWNGPNFRSLLPTHDSTRFFPKFESVLQGNLCPDWECIAEVARTFKFAFTARDNQPEGQTQSKIQVITVQNTSGPFVVNYPNVLAEIPVDSSMNVQWDVANTDVSPVNCTHVNIWISTDGGANFIQIAHNTPNDGNETVSLAGIPSSLDCYVLVEAADNVFYAVSENFNLGYAVEEECNSYTYSGSAISIPDNTDNYDAVANLNIPNDLPGSLISDVNIYTDVSHTFVNDLRIKAKSPNGTEVILWENDCGSEDNIMATFDDEGENLNCSSPVSGDIIPSESLSSFNNESPEGTWQLMLADFYSNDTGSLNSFSIEVCSAVYTSLSVDDVENQDIQLSIYPQPAENKLFIQSDASFNEYTIYHSDGKLIQKGIIENNSISISSLVNGMYILQVENENGKLQTATFLVKK